MSTIIEAGKGWYYGFGDQRGYRVTFTDNVDYQNYIKERKYKKLEQNLKAGEGFMISLPVGDVGINLFNYTKEGTYYSAFNQAEVHYKNAYSGSISVYARSSYTEVRLDSDIFSYVHAEGNVTIGKSKSSPTIVYKLFGPPAVLNIQQTGKGIGNLEITNLPSIPIRIYKRKKI